MTAGPRVPVTHTDISALKLSSADPLIKDKGLRTYAPSSGAAAKPAGRRAGYGNQSQSMGSLLQQDTHAPAPRQNDAARKGAGAAREINAPNRNVVSHKGTWKDATESWKPCTKPAQGPKEGRVAVSVDQEMKLGTGGGSRKMSFSKPGPSPEIHNGVGHMTSFYGTIKGKTNKKHIPEPRGSK
eukprot:TRINITY_DN3897_c1_g1_i1.p2 TRINITY_DN3897_c1_g1~~TRINITY_DN3897_c1_g1_i1.p2  ORF type:complete len:184 (+),score=33.96 TRINITY_DN3897_c1_g1_i1:75-626(+)